MKGKECLDKIERATEEIHKVVVGLDDLIQALWIGALADGHLIIKGLPGLAKTLTAKTFAAVIGATYKRMQFSPDVMPLDVVVGYDIFAPSEKKLPDLKKGPIFTQIYLGDEINRAPEKVQAIHMEPMEEKQVTIEGKTYPLGDLFLCFFTLNPVEIMGTYGLGEAFAERVMLIPTVYYPPEELEREIVAVSDEAKKAKVEKIISVEEILELRKVINNHYLPLKDKDSPAIRYIVRLVREVRKTKWVEYGPSPRGGEDLKAASRVFAFLKGDEIVLPEHVKEIAKMALREKITLTGEAAGISHDQVIEEALDRTPIL